MTADAEAKTSSPPEPRLRGRAALWLLNGLLWLPYGVRVPLCGWLVAWVIAPLAGYRKRVRDNLARIMPDLPRAEVRRLMRAVPDNLGRSTIEIWSGAEFAARMTETPIRGPGLAAVAAARAAGKPAVLVTGHFGNYDAARAAMIANGYRVGALYRQMSDPVFNEAYVSKINAVGQPMFLRSRRGMVEMMRFFRDGGMVALAMDQHMSHGAELSFMGHPAFTALSAAEMALKHDALLVPFYGLRLPDGLSFEIRAEEPIPHGTAEEMTQALNDSLDRLVRQYPDQWLWVHRRWKRPGGRS